MLLLELIFGINFTSGFPLKLFMQKKLEVTNLRYDIKMEDPIALKLSLNY